MTKCVYKSIQFGATKVHMVNLCNSIIEHYQAQDLKLTLRQLYYQLVTRNAVTNEERSYKKVGKYVSDARLAGLMDWDAIEDRVRVPVLPHEYQNLEALVQAALWSYRLPRWQGQRHYVELWVEKDALSGVLAPLAEQYHITLMVNRGYSSQSAMYEAGRRFYAHDDNECVLLYLGDHDPSGEDMVRDIGDRLAMFGAVVDVRKVALTRNQVDQYDPPPNPAKMSDSRAKGYVERHGNESWEVDALPPEVLRALITGAMADLVDMDLIEEIKVREEKDKKALTVAVRGLK